VRAFLAIPLPAPLREALAAAGREVPGLRAQHPDTLHLTVRFLGEIGDPGPFAEAAAAVAARHAPFTLHLKGIGAFPDARRPRVVWVGLSAGVAEAVALAADVEDAVVALGLPRERRPFTAHITLGRFRGRPPRPLEPDPGRDFRPAPAERLVLYRTTLLPQGARHEAVAEVSLGRAR